MGWHIWHTNSFAPFYRAEQDYQMFARYSDFLKVVMYHNSGGPRMARYIQNVNSTLFADLTPEQTTEFTYRVQQYHVRSVARAIADRRAFGRLRAPGDAPRHRRRRRHQDADLARYRNRRTHWRTRKKTTPDDVYAAVKATFDAGAHGIILSRKYSEMRLDNLRAAGRAVRASVTRA